MKPAAEEAREHLLARPMGVIVPPWHKHDLSLAFMAAHAVPAEVEALTAAFERRDLAAREEERERCRLLAKQGGFQIGATAPECSGVIRRTRECIAAAVANGRSWDDDIRDDEPMWRMGGEPMNASALRTLPPVRP